MARNDKDTDRERADIRTDAVETTGKTVEKALEKALETLHARIDEVEIKILDPGQKGVLNIFGTRDAKIRVTRKKSASGVEEIVDDIARAIMECLDVNYRLFSENENGSTYVNIETAGVDGLLIGRKGDTLTSLQHLVGRIVSKRMGGYQRLTLDVGGYLRNRHEILKQKALKAAEKVKKTNHEIVLEPMPAAERRIVHMALADLDGISTYTIGNGEMRKVCISPARQDGGGRREGGQRDEGGPRNEGGRRDERGRRGGGRREGGRRDDARRREQGGPRDEGGRLEEGGQREEGERQGNR